MFDYQEGLKGSACPSQRTPTALASKPDAVPKGTAAPDSTAAANLKQVRETDQTEKARLKVRRAILPDMTPLLWRDGPVSTDISRTEHVS
ncbi:MAG: hypothetical protein ABSA57_08570 [Candidatus Acidiferrales bacterium]